MIEFRGNRQAVPFYKLKVLRKYALGLLVHKDQLKFLKFQENI